MQEYNNLSLNLLPTPTMLCKLGGVIVDANTMATNLLGRNLLNIHLDKVFDFSKSDLTGCRTLNEVVELIRGRSLALNVVSIIYCQPPVNHINLYFSFFTQNDEEFMLIGLKDVSERYKLIEAFEYKQNLLDNIITTSTDALIVFDSYGCIELFSPAAESMFGKTSTEMIIEDIYTLFEPDCHEKVEAIFDHLKSANDAEEIFVFEDLLPMNTQGVTFPASITFSKSQKDTDSLFFMVISDKSLFQRFVNSVNDAYIKTNQRGQIIDINNKTETLFHYDRRTLINKHISFLGIKSSNTSNVLNDVSLLVNNDSDKDEDYTARNRRGSELTLNLTVWPQEVNNIRLNNLIIRDISQKKLAEKQLIYSAFTDSLTNLSNRANFTRELAEQIETAKQTGKTFSLLAMDLDKFKGVNDTFGHDYGDELLKAAANRLTACVRDHDLVSRMGGDEFTIIIRDIPNVDMLNKIAERILRTFRRDFTIKEKRLSISSSIGIAIYPDDAQNPEELFKAADMAMYTAKRCGKDAYRYFTAEMYKEYERIKLIERALIGAIQNNELSLHYQPKISFSGECAVGFEALLRWNNPDLGQITPDEFIPIAEETGYIVELTRWVLSTAVKAMKSWSKKCTSFAKNNYTIAVNISADHFKSDIYSDLSDLLLKEEFDPKLLEIEITEGILLEHTSEVVDILKRISELGIQISMDDFGTGYSSLQYLKYFPLNTIKIDRSFVRDVQDDTHNIFIIESIISIAKRLNLKLIAEGVETNTELMSLVSLGCDVFQGYYYSKPLPEEQILPYLENLNNQRNLRDKPLKIEQKK